MRADEFVTRRRPEWDRLEKLLQRAGTSRVGGLLPTEVLSLAALYRRATADFARAKRDAHGERQVVFAQNFRRNIENLGGSDSAPRFFNRAAQAGLFLLDGFQTLLDETLQVRLTRQANDRNESCSRIQSIELEIAKDLFTFKSDGNFSEVCPLDPVKVLRRWQRRHLSALQRLQLLDERCCLIGKRIPNGALAGALDVGVKSNRGSRRKRPRWSGHLLRPGS